MKYDVPNGRIQLWRYDAEKGWMQFDKEIPVAFADGDTVSVQMRANGKFAIHQNGKLLARCEMDRDCLLTAESTGNITFHLYGLGAIGEKTTD